MLGDVVGFLGFCFVFVLGFLSVFLDSGACCFVFFFVVYFLSGVFLLFVPFGWFVFVGCGLMCCCFPVWLFSLVGILFVLGVAFLLWGAVFCFVVWCWGGLCCWSCVSWAGVGGCFGGV